MNVITLSGSAGSGKDTYAKYMREILQKSGYRVIIVHEADMLKHICKDHFNWDGEKDLYGRYLLQHIGTDLFRKHFPAFWADLTAKILFTYSVEDLYDVAIVPDVRYENELGRLQFYDFNKIDSVRVMGSDKAGDRMLSEEEKNHSSENEWKEINFKYNISGDDPLLGSVLCLAALGYPVGRYKDLLK